jgi:hypothetical protein
MASTVLQPIADHIGAILKTFQLGVSQDTWAGKDLRFGRAGAAEIEVPDIARTGIEQAESQLGADDWDLEFAVSIWVNITTTGDSQKRLIALVEQWIAAVDADVTFGGLVLEAKVVEAKRQYQIARPPARGLRDHARGPEARLTPPPTRTPDALRRAPT